MTPPRSPLGVAWTSYSVRRFPTALEFLEHCRSNGAAGIQAPVRPAEDAGALRRQCESYGMYLEAAVPVAGDEATERAFRSAKEAGARCGRGACLSGRRYETFKTLDEWKAFVGKSKAGLAATVRIAEKTRLPLALENHKDWTSDQLAGLMKEYSSEYLGVCVDTGNNLSLLEDSYQLAERLAPWALSTHMKDMAFERHPDGFRMAEVPFRTGALDLARIAAIIRAKRPDVPLTIEMITRNPLLIPCLKPVYWATMPDRRGADLAAMLSLVSQHAMELPGVDGLSPAARRDWEEENVRACLHAAREARLGL